MVDVLRDLDHELKWNFLEYTKENRITYAKNRQFRQFLQPIFDFQGDERVLDLGCGIGTLCKLIAPFLKNGGEIIGIDLDPVLVAYGNEHWARRDYIHLEVGDANQISYSDAHFDVIASFGLFENISNVDRVLSEALRVLVRPGKLISIHIDMINYTVLPRDEASERYYRDLIKGMQVMGIDIKATRFITACKKMNLPLEEFIFTMEYKTKITENMIHLVENSMEVFMKSEGILKQAFEFNYQFLKWAEWSETDLWDFINNQYSIEAHLKFLREHIGEEYYRKIPIHIFRIQVT